MTEDTQTTEDAGEPGIVKVSVASKKTDREVEFERNFGSTLDEAAEMFGADVVLSVFQAQAVIRAQGAARSVLDAKSEDGSATHSTQAAIDAGLSYTPGVSRRKTGTKKDPVQQLTNLVAQGELSIEDIVAQLQAQAEG